MIGFVWENEDFVWRVKRRKLEMKMMSDSRVHAND
jgi:hypothetical protein